LKSAPATVADLVEKEIKKFKTAREDLQGTTSADPTGVSTGTKQGSFAYVTTENKAKIAKYASEHGITASMRYF